MKRSLAAMAVLALMAVWLLASRTGQPDARAQDPAGWGTIKGQIVYNGEPPARAALNVNPCPANGPVLDEQWVVDPKTQGVRDVFVWLEGVDGATLPIHPKLMAVPKNVVMVDQPKCAFVPHALALRQGQTLLAKNTSPIVHNFKYGGNPAVNPGGNPLIPPGGSVPIKDLMADNLPIVMECGIHGWMRGYIRVYDHPYYEVTGTDGKFVIKDAPAGNYVLKVWHGGSGWLGGAKGKAGQPISIKADGTTDVGDLKIGPAKK